VPICDVATGMYGAIGILAALHERLRTGQGQHVDVCLMDTPVSWLVWEAAQYLATGEVACRLGSGHRLGVSYRAYQGSDGKWLTIGASSNKHVENVCQMLGVPELAVDPRLDDGGKRRGWRRADPDCFVAC
jgi:crotonobetainyl-CoA:carnitine CoA-transferase CaiB-like acyl-CoA transferase